MTNTLHAERHLPSKCARWDAGKLARTTFVLAVVSRHRAVGILLGGISDMLRASTWRTRVRSARAAEKDHQGYVLVETDPSGHRLMYVARFLSEAQQEGWHVVLAVNERVRHSAQFEEFLGGMMARGEVVLEVIGDLRPGVRAVRQLRGRWSNRCLVVLDGDLWLPSLLRAWPRRRPAIVLLMRAPRSSPSRLRALVKILMVQAFRWIRSGRVMQLVGPIGTTAQPDRWPRLGPVNDPLPVGAFPDRHAAREGLGLSADQIVLLIAGAIERRKSSVQVLEWLVTFSECERPLLLLAGPIRECMTPAMMSEPVRSLVSEGHVRVLDRFLEEGELRRCYAASDTVLILHENQGPSGALAYAVAAGRPVIAWGSEIVTNVVQQCGLGVVAGGRDPASLTHALRVVQERSSEWGRSRPYPNPRNSFATQLLAGDGAVSSRARAVR